jgi:hypothetical protein
MGGWLGGWAQRDLSGCDIKMRCGARDEWCDINVATKARCRIRSKPESGVSQHNRQHDNGAPSRSLPSYPTPSAPGGQQGTSSCRGRRRGRPVCLCVSMCVCVCVRARARASSRTSSCRGRRPPRAWRPTGAPGRSGPPAPPTPHPYPRSRKTSSGTKCRGCGRGHGARVASEVAMRASRDAQQSRAKTKERMREKAHTVDPHPIKSRR